MEVGKIINRHMAIILDEMAKMGADDVMIEEVREYLRDLRGDMETFEGIMHSAIRSVGNASSSYAGGGEADGNSIRNKASHRN